MWCSEVREALPLLSELPDLGDGEAAEVRAHAAGCPACAELLRAYEADERALSAARKAPREQPAALSGFADAVMARLSEAGPAAPLPILAGVGEPEGKVIKLGGSWPAVAALAAALLLALGLLIGTPRTPLPEPGLARGVPEAAPAPAVEPSFAVSPAEQPKVSPAPEGPAVAFDRVPAPVRDPAPMPRRMRRPAGRDADVVPVDRGSARNGEEQMRELLEKMAPQLQRLFPPPPPRPQRKDEVRF